MGSMPLTLSWPEIALRLLLAVVAGSLIGLNRGESGNAAGLRTTLLVCLAACIAMLQVNALLTQHGKPDDSFVSLDLMRLPLGILSGVGFIGAGTILHRDGLVQGVTTAATMWFVTVIGLCAGGGQYALAVTGTAVGLLVLHTFSRVERWVPRHRQATLILAQRVGTDALVEKLASVLSGYGCQVVPRGLERGPDEMRVAARFELRWYARPGDIRVERELSRVAELSGDSASWSSER